jgi:putative ATP-binding cassette transporter
LGAAVTKHDGFEEPRAWHDVLSFGELQLLAVARAIFLQAKFAFLDRPHSALTMEALKHVLHSMAKRGITCVSFDDGIPDREIHDACLELREDGTWKWSETV